MLYFVRHGETDWNREPARCQGWADVPLNATGRRQARQLGAHLSGGGIQAIVTSHLARARQTAEIIRGELGGEPPLTVDERLAETHRGRWESRLFKDIIAEEPDEWRRYRQEPRSFTFPGGESLAAHQRRVLEAVRDAALRGRTTLIVTHGGSIRLVRSFLTGAGIAAFHRMDVPNGEILEVPCAGLAERIAAHLQAGEGDARPLP